MGKSWIICVIVSLNLLNLKITFKDFYVLVEMMWVNKMDIKRSVITNMSATISIFIKIRNINKNKENAYYYILLNTLKSYLVMLSYPARFLRTSIFICSNWMVEQIFKYAAFAVLTNHMLLQLYKNSSCYWLMHFDLFVEMYLGHNG